MRLAALGPLIAGIAAFAVTYSDRGNFTDAADESEYVALQVGWGLNLALGASLVLGVVGPVEEHRTAVRPRGLAPRSIPR
jgi:hypothetical protein